MKELPEYPLDTPNLPPNFALILDCEKPWMENPDMLSRLARDQDRNRIATIERITTRLRTLKSMIAKRESTAAMEPILKELLAAIEEHNNYGDVISPHYEEKVRTVTDAIAKLKQQEEILRIVQLATSTWLRILSLCSYHMVNSEDVRLDENRTTGTKEGNSHLTA